jgi:transposase-like protein
LRSIFGQKTVMLIQLHKLLDVAQCYDTLRSVRWPTGVSCPHCSATTVVKNGKDTHQIHCQHYHCKACHAYFDDVTDTVFSGSHQGIHQWITVLYLMNLNVSMAQIAQELSIAESTAQEMCATIREGVVKKNIFHSLADWLKLMNVMSLLATKDNPTKSEKRAVSPDDDV